MRPTHCTQLLLALSLVLLSFCAEAGTVTATTSGNWNNSATWQGGNIPGNGDDVIIGSNVTVTLLGNVSIKSLTVNGTLDAATYVISFGGAGSISINGTLRTANTDGLVNGSTGTLSTNNNPPLTLGSSSSIEYYGNGYQVITVRDYAHLTIAGNRNGQYLTIGAGTIGITGTFTHSATNDNYNNSATIAYKGSGQTVAVFPYYHLDLTNATGISFPAGTVTITGTFTPGTTTGASTGSINFKGSSQTIPAFQYNNLDLTNANSVSFATTGIIAVRGSFTPGYTSLATTGSSIRFNGSNQTVPAFGYYNLDLTGASGTGFATTNYPGIDIYGTFTPGSIISATSGSYFNFKGAAGQAIPAFAYHHLDLNNSSHSFPSGIVSIAGSFTNTSNNSPTQGTIRFNGSNQALNNSFNFYNLDLTGASNFSMTNYTVGIAGSFNPGSLGSAGSNYSMNFTGSNQTIPAFQYHNLNLTGATGTGFANGVIGIGGSFTPGSVTSITQGTISYTGSSPNIQPLTYYGLDISAPGAVWMGAGGTYTINGPFSVSANTQLNLNAWTNTTFNIGGSLAYNGNGGQSLQYLTLNLLNSGTLSGSAAGYSPNISIASGASYTLSSNFSMTSGSTLTVNGTLVTNGYQVAGGGAVSANSSSTIKVSNATGLAGSIANSGGYTFAAGARYEFNGTAAQSTGFSGVTMGTPASVTISNSSADVTLDADLTLGNGGQFIVSSAGRFQAGTRSISFGSGGSVTINGTFRTANTAGFSGGASTSIKGTNNPTITLGSGSTIDYTASAAQTVTGRSDYHHLALSNGQKSLSAAATLAGNISLAGGARLLLGANNLSVGGTMSGDASNFVVTNGTGSVVLRNIGSGGKQFVVGASSSSYSPLTILQASGLDWTVNVAPSIAPAIATSAESIQRTWTITPSVNPTPSAATLTFQYNEADAGILGGNWNSNGNVTFKRYNGTAWTTATGNIAPGGSPGGVRTASAYGFTQFSPWIVAQGGSALPVRFLTFSGKKESGANKLQWSTAQESNNAGFVLERSPDGRNFTALARVASRAPGGNSSSPLDYTYTDLNAANGSWYYRLQQQDQSGAAHYSAVLRISDAKRGILAGGVYPSPAGNRVQATLLAEKAQEAQVRIIDAGGRVLLQRSQSLEAGSNLVQIDLTILPAGVYLLQARLADGSSEAVRFQKL